VIRGIDKDVRKLLISAERQGCVVAHDKSLHIRVTNGKGDRITLPGTGHESHVAKQARSRLRRLGVTV